MRGPTPVRSSKHPSQKRSTASPASGHSSLLRNIQELPPEILAETLLESMTDGEVFGLKRHRELASVCRTWRDVVLSTPQFWSAVTDDPQAGDPFRIVPAKLRRFKDGPLTIKYIDKPTDPQSSVWDLLQPTISRWEEVTLTLGLGNHSKLRSTLEQGMPNLRRLTLLSEGSPQEVKLGPTPRLAELCLSRRASLDLISGTTLSTLRRLTIKSIRPDSPLLINILPTLTECSLLELLHISSIRSFPANRTHSVNFAELDVTLPLLRVLEIEDTEASFISLLLRHLRADGLEQLTVHCLILGGCTLAVLRAVSEPRDGCGLILPVLNCKYTSSEICLSLGERWLYIQDKTGRLSLKLWLNGRKDVRNVADLLDPVYRHCAASARSITMAIHLHHVESLESLHLLCGAAPMVASIHCNDGEQYGQLSRCVLNGISQNVCRTCPPGGPRPWNTFSRLSELRISVPYESNPLPEYARGVHVAYLSRRRIVQSAASSPGPNSLNDIPDLKIYVNDAFVPPDLGSLDQDS